MSAGCLTLIFYSELVFPSGHMRWSDVSPEAGEYIYLWKWQCCNCINKCKTLVSKSVQGNFHGHRGITTIAKIENTNISDLCHIIFCLA